MTTVSEHEERYSKKKTSSISLLSFLLGFIDAFVIYTLSSYFADIVGEQLVGVVYFIVFGIHLGLLFSLDSFVRQIGRVRYLVFCLGLSLLAIGILPSVSAGIAGLFFGILYLAFSNTVWVALDILLENYSEDKLSGRIRGFHLMVMNIGFLLAPYLSTQILSRFGHPAIFIIVFVGYVVALLLAVLLFRSDYQVVHHPEMRFLQTLREVMQRSSLRHIFAVSFALEFFYSIMIIYMALHLQNIGFSWEEIGLIFTIMLLPFVFLQYPIGVLADRRFGEKEMLALSFLLTITATIGVISYSGKMLFAWAGILFVSRVGVAAIEVLRDSYFYKQIDGNDTQIIAFFRMARPTANMLGAVISVGLLAFFDLRSVFYAVAVVLFFALFHIFKLKDTESEFERKRRLGLPG
ncbi:MAG: MFS transporter [Candidatus Moranbacteria bacterium]|nr:MFS transporter [Candidatus Moranbacteria bacterium]